MGGDFLKRRGACDRARSERGQLLKGVLRRGPFGFGERGVHGLARSRPVHLKAVTSSSVMRVKARICAA